MSRIILGPKHANETISAVFDFTSRIAIGETISSATTTATVYSGTDATPSAIISGSASISGGKVTQAITGGTTGVTYFLTCAATTSTSQVLELNSYLVITPESI